VDGSSVETTWLEPQAQILTTKICRVPALENCADGEDQGYNKCVEQRDEDYRDCCDWWPCRWACKAWVWVSHIVCVVWQWISKWVCRLACWVYTSICKLVVSAIFWFVRRVVLWFIFLPYADHAAAQRRLEPCPERARRRGEDMRRRHRPGVNAQVNTCQTVPRNTKTPP